MFNFKISDNLLRSPDISASGKILWMYFYKMQEDTGDIIRLSAKVIASDTGLERLTVIKQSKVLQGLGWLKLIEGKGTTNRPMWNYEAIVKEVNDN
jgi:hypothetical protein